ncbi:hypothetical protein AtubIFM56815_007694 [Aspergillus tubingensis]|uniref:BZIP transcription factor n=2 Tax=Aspergillus subgen. Circumdati TaxID=2720871 RepID=A0A100IEL9_ASPNG|nr:bZIP transcription factor [Aspergillus tubingensis]GAQ39266.1 bZIP transcription factor [Aspergillus niger]GFN17833.1 bZIP transcription factor [Aspergillus tubingensis]GLA64820.1 hypothetical protein AtubIFM54640_006552 [Aspergillus tubingensis]GLA83497.1 hypothetical protein AtubIFM56815_007694 [Aspergillus tubingensis]GLA90940.1 hypothetical protein AtubIFM57143_000555 [Aspergillus tubingensis]
MDYSFYSNHPQQPYPLYGVHGLPTPDQGNSAPQAEAIQGAFAPLGAQNYRSFDPNLRFQDPHAAAAFVAPPHSPPESLTKQSVTSNEFSSQNVDRASYDGDDQLLDQSLGRSSSEEKESLTPAQSKRKAQNRAAQRAFRERKERHVRELEEKVNNLENASNTLVADNERLKRELAKFTTENEILRATSTSMRQSGQRPTDEEPTTTGPLQYSPTDFKSDAVGGNGPAHRITICGKTGEKLLDSGATWDLIQNHELFKRGLVNIGDVSGRLQGTAQCDGQGPAFRESQVLQAIEESAAAGNDDLL